MLNINRFKKIAATLLTFTMLFMSIANVFAQDNSNINSNSVTSSISTEIKLIPDVFFDPNHPNAIKDPSVIGKFDKMYKEINGLNSNKRTTRGVPAIIAVYAVPGIGEVALTATGAIIVAGVLYKTGSWMYNKVQDFFASLNEQKKYEKAKEAGEETDNHAVTDGSKLPSKGAPNSSQDKIDNNGKVLERRYYDKNVNADLDIHNHDNGNPKQHPKVPHRHNWENRSPGKWY